MKRNWFFLTEKLQITPAERTAVTTLIAVLVVLWSIPASWFRPEPFDQAYYAPVLAEFQEKVQLREIEREQTLARFYPAVDAVPAAEPGEHPGPNHSTADLSGNRSVPSLSSNSTTPSHSPLPLSSLTNSSTLSHSPLSTSTNTSSTSTSASNSSSSSTTVPGTNEAGQTLTLPAGLQNPDPADSPGGAERTFGGAGNVESGSPRSSVPVNADTLTVKTGDGKAPESGTGARININTADVTELQKLPGIGPSIAARIVEYRTQNGPFRTIEEITGVRGIGEVRLNNLRNSITVH